MTKRRGRGRPPLPPDEKKSEILRVALTPVELAELKRRAGPRRPDEYLKTLVKAHALAKSGARPRDANPRLVAKVENLMKETNAALEAQQRLIRTQEDLIKLLKDEVQRTRGANYFERFVDELLTPEERSAFFKPDRFMWVHLNLHVQVVEPLERAGRLPRPLGAPSVDQLWPFIMTQASDAEREQALQVFRTHLADEIPAAMAERAVVPGGGIESVLTNPVLRALVQTAATDRAASPRKR